MDKFNSAIIYYNYGEIYIKYNYIKKKDLLLSFKKQLELKVSLDAFTGLYTIEENDFGINCMDSTIEHLKKTIEVEIICMWKMYVKGKALTKKDKIMRVLLQTYIKEEK